MVSCLPFEFHFVCGVGRQPTTGACFLSARVDAPGSQQREGCVGLALSAVGEPTHPAGRSPGVVLHRLLHALPADKPFEATYISRLPLSPGPSSPPVTQLPQMLVERNGILQLPSARLR